MFVSVSPVIGYMPQKQEVCVKMNRNNLGKTLLLVALSTTLMGVSLPAQAIEVQPDSTATVEPFYLGITRLTCTLDISSNGGANCRAKIAMAAGYSSEYTLTLVYSKDGRTWSEATSWSGSNRSDITRSYFVSSKGDYQLRLTVKVLDSSGKYVATYGKNSNVVSY